MKKEELKAKKQLINRYTNEKEVTNVGELGRGIRYGNSNIDIRKYDVMCSLVDEYNTEHHTKLSVKDHSWPIVCMENKWFSPNLGMFDYPGSAGYQKSSEAIKIAILMNQAAEGPENAPYAGLHFKSASNVSIPTLKKCKVVVAKKPRKAKKASKAQVVSVLGLEPVASSAHSCSCKDCKALDALAHANAVIDKLIK